MQVYMKLKFYLITDNQNKMSRVLYKGKKKNYVNMITCNPKVDLTLQAKEKFTPKYLHLSQERRE